MSHLISAVYMSAIFKNLVSSAPANSASLLHRHAQITPDGRLPTVVEPVITEEKFHDADDLDFPDPDDIQSDVTDQESQSDEPDDDDDVEYIRPSQMSTRQRSALKKMQHRNICFTMFDMTKFPPKELNPEVIRYLIAQRELTMTGRPHWQGYIEFFNPKRWDEVQSLFGDHTMYLANRKGTAQQASDYCRKLVHADGSSNRVDMKEQPFVFGTMSKQGERYDKSRIVELIAEGKSSSYIKEKAGEIYLQFHSGIDKMISSARKHRITAPSVYYWFGNGGLGKTTAAKQLIDGVEFKTFYVKPIKNWEGYDQQDVVIIDDMDENTRVCINEFNIICDSSPYLIDVKYGSVPFNSKVIVYTSNFVPEHTFAIVLPAQQWSVKRRFKKIKHFTLDANNVVQINDYDFWPHVVAPAALDYRNVNRANLL